ncbi:maleylpyruvate isomerase N-terminal domain-containing protein [Nocardioides sp. URHA0020]|uniref:maleylpyruvate isomerase N-terminal domain-containing protein n=1 Tax=Nocardioides sp. URHA0020 TaxID=1380392 RepID=UPI0004913005|nr:maleylpyruvate isomerase N-terminal domain-containing protein [Nocardioides sp. URHA0020]
MAERETAWGDLYRANVAAVTRLVSGLDRAALATTVPGSPEWTVQDVVAHLAGGPADSLSGRTEGAPGPTWTARHVAERRGRPLGELTDEMAANQDAVAESTVDNPRPAVVWDIAVHHADLHEALGLGVPPAEMWAPVLAAVAPMKFGTAGVPADLDDYEVFRAIFSRRSRAQMQAWGLPLSAEQLDELCIFGPREDDQPTP